MTGDMYKLRTIKTQVEQGRYRVDPGKTADAMIRWFSISAESRRGPFHAFERQNECSKPDSAPPASEKLTPGGPSSTDPIQVRPLFDGGSL